MTKIPDVLKANAANPKLFHWAVNALRPVLVIGAWNLRFVCYLVLGIWDFCI